MFAEIHFIEIVPKDIYHIDSAYIEWESSFFDEFVELFPAENICFISDDAIVGIEDADYILCGIDYAPFSFDEKNTVAFSPQRSRHRVYPIRSHERR
jgi:hypothetical protein